MLPYTVAGRLVPAWTMPPLGQLVLSSHSHLSLLLCFGL